MVRRALLLIVGTLTLAACADQGPGVAIPAQLQQTINDGQLEPGQDSVVLLYHYQAGGMCTGTIIAPRVVLTAKHCVYPINDQGDVTGPLHSASGWQVSVGSGMYSTTARYNVSEVRSTPGTSTYDNDIAVMITTSAMTQTPHPIVNSLGSSFLGTSVHLIGYGVNTCGGQNSGTKYRTTDTVQSFEGYNSFMTQGLGANSGDSGGPVFNLNYEVVGVMVSVPLNYQGEMQCGTTICTRIDKFLSLINGALEDTGACVPDGPEICGDGIDNDCNDLIDDGCSALGTPCSADDQCVSGICLDMGNGSECVQGCDPTLPFTSCAAGQYCRDIDCLRGVCTPGGAGTGTFGSVCNSDLDCGTLYCRAASDGTKYCGFRCGLDQGECLPNEVCTPQGGTCGSCQTSSLYSGLRGLGELCQLGRTCRSGLCIDDQGATYCSHTCSAAAPCPEGFHCRGETCIRGFLGDIGHPCQEAEDCQAGLTCYQSGGGDSFCSQTDCEFGTACPFPLECIPLPGASVCDTQIHPAGERCAANAECISAACVAFGGEDTCSQACGRGIACPTGTYCTLNDQDMFACAPNSLPPGTTNPGAGARGGCQTAGQPQPQGLLWLLLGLLVLIRRRRTARR